MSEQITGMWELLDAIKEVIQSADPNKRAALDETLQAYHDDFPDEFHWAFSAQAPTLLCHLMHTISAFCEPDETDERPGRSVIRLVHRKPEGNAWGGAWGLLHYKGGAGCRTKPNGGRLSDTRAVTGNTPMAAASARPWKHPSAENPSAYFSSP